MRFMTFVKCSENSGMPPQELIAAIQQLCVEATQNGTLIDTGGLAPTAAGVQVRLEAGKLNVVDGPFTETKEVVGGYAVFELPSREAAIEAGKRFMELHRKHWPGWEGTCEIRQMFTAGECAKSAA